MMNCWQAADVKSTYIRPRFKLKLLKADDLKVSTQGKEEVKQK